MFVAYLKRAWKALAAALRVFGPGRGARPAPRLQASPGPTSAATPVQEPAPGSPPWLAALARQQDRLTREMVELSAELEALERDVRELQTRTEDLWRKRKATSSGPGESTRAAPAPRTGGEP